MVIGIAGGSGCGKTTFVKALNARFENEVTVISQDAYYHDKTHLDAEARRNLNFDHPDSIEFELLTEHVSKLKHNLSVETPIYDFITVRRSEETLRIDPVPILIVEGILVLNNPQLRELMDLRIFMHTDTDYRLIRIMQRDVETRGRDVQEVLHRWAQTVRPMHDRFVEPSREFADIIIPHGGRNVIALDLVTGFIKDRIKG